MTDRQEIWASVRALYDAYYNPGVYSSSVIERHFRNIEKRLMGIEHRPRLGIYRIKVRTDTTLMVKATSRKEAQDMALDDLHDVNCYGDHARSIVEVKDLSDPVWLVAELAMLLEEKAFNNKHQVCQFCGGPKGKHAVDCIIDLARQYLFDERERTEP